MNLLKSAPVRKSQAYLKQSLRLYGKLMSPLDMYRMTPVVLANSLPKSGTHLLSQILEALPVNNYGTFWASTPSISFRERKNETIIGSIEKSAPGELASAHLFYDDEVAKALANLNTAHFFIYRDPRDVVVSEAYYLAHMNKWHRLHVHFKRLASFEEQIMFAIQGADADFPFDYPDIGTRFKRYAGWLNREDVYSVKFEDLVSEVREVTVDNIVAYYLERANCTSTNKRELTQKAIDHIDPERSHTYRKGKAGGWRHHFNESHKKAFKRVANDLLIELGYEASDDWA